MIRRLFWLFAFAFAGLVASAGPLEPTMRRLVKTEPGEDQWKTVETRAAWAPAGTAVVICDIEKYWCPTITSDQVLGGHPFRFSADTKPAGVFHN